MMRVSWCVVLVAGWLMGCGAARESEGDPTPVEVSPASAEPNAMDGSDRPTWPSCPACRVRIIVDREEPRRIERIELEVPAERGKATGVASVQEVTLELASPKGSAEAVKLDAGGWKPGAAVTAAVEKPGFALADWQGGKATLTLSWQSGGALARERVTIPIEVVRSP